MFHQFEGPKPSDDQQPMDLPQGKRVLIFVFNIITKNRSMEEAIEETKPLMMLVFYCLEKVKLWSIERRTLSTVSIDLHF